MTAPLAFREEPHPYDLTKAQASTDDALLELWLHGVPANTQRAYRADIARLRATLDKPFAQLSLADLHAFADTLDTLAPSSRSRTIASLKSLFSFALRIGYLRLNVAAALKTPKHKNTIGERFMTEEEIIRILTLEDTLGDPRNYALLRTLYAAALRVSEACALCWRDVQPHADSAVLVVFGKGAKTRTVRIDATTYARLLAIRTESAAPESPLFVSQRGGPLGPSAVWRITQSAALRAGVRVHQAEDGSRSREISPHWFRHAHATHAIDPGAPLSLVQATLGHASLTTTGIYAHARPNEASGRYLPL
jgi:integrase/recombinase XerD